MKTIFKNETPVTEGEELSEELWAAWVDVGIGYENALSDALRLLRAYDAERTAHAKTREVLERLVEAVRSNRWGRNRHEKMSEDISTARLAAEARLKETE